jgi:dTDP-glucose pyrophosphorylase/CBS domain-containing protein
MTTLNRELTDLCVSPRTPIREAIVRIDKNTLGIVFVVDESFRLVGAVNDGDLRRAMLAAVDIEAPIQVLLDQKLGSPYALPVSAPLGTPRAELLRILLETQIRRLPLVDEEMRLCDVVLVEDFFEKDALPVEAMVMAGGLGTRLRPLTDKIPKPMLPVGGRPLLETIVLRLREAGIRKVYLTTHYMPEIIVDYFGDGGKWGVDIAYLHEEEPLGTAGALGLLRQPTSPLLVINGDILTSLNFRVLYEYHKTQTAEFTLGVRHFHMEVPYGVVECEDNEVKALREKPVFTYLVNAGIYLMEPEVIDRVPKNTPYNMTDLLSLLMQEDRRVISFPVREYWLDIGRHDDYAQAELDVEDMLD